VDGDLVRQRVVHADDYLSAFDRADERAGCHEGTALFAESGDIERRAVALFRAPFATAGDEIDGQDTLGHRSGDPTVVVRSDLRQGRSPRRRRTGVTRDARGRQDGKPESR
jgi:hypothetical protein